MIQAKKLKGFCDFSPREAKQREKIISSLRHEAIQAGFDEIVTPSLEYAEVLLGSGGTETDKEVYRFEDHGGRQVALRFDLTVPFARFVAEHQGTLTVPFKKFQVGEVWRGEKPQKGRYRQFAQADVDIIGTDHAAADIEVLQLIALTLDGLLDRPFTIQLGHRVVLSHMIRSIFPSTVTQGEGRVLIAIDKLAKIGTDKVAELIATETGEGREKIMSFLEIIAAPFDEQRLTEQFPDLKEELQRFSLTVNTLRQVTRKLKVKFTENLSIARGLGYYTGIVFETTIDDLPGFGSVSSGGRYNQLVSRFSKQEFPGVGGSIGVDRLLAALSELEKDQPLEREGVFIALGSENAVPVAFDLAQKIREAGILCEVSVKLSKLAQQFKYADRKNRAFVVTLGDDELANKTFSLKNLANGTEEKGIPGIRELIQKL